MYPRLTGLGQSIAAGKRQLEPAFTCGTGGVIVKSFSCACRHGVVLGTHQINNCGLRSCEAQPGSNSSVGAVLGPVCLRPLGLDSHRLGLAQPGRAPPGAPATGSPLDI